MTAVAPAEALTALLRRPRFEVLPFDGIEDDIRAHLGTDVKVTVTASPSKGLEPTIALSERLAHGGYDVVPHLSARLVKDAAELHEILDRLLAAGVRELFVPAGDATEPAGDFEGAAALLTGMGNARARFQAIGITGYPESHHIISDAQTIQAMSEKATMATHVISQLCFDAEAIARWISAVRARGVELPIVLGMPGCVAYAKLIRISMRIGLGESARFLNHHRSWTKRLIARQFSPDALLRGLAPVLVDPAANVTGLHLYTFNEVAGTERWRRSTLARLAEPSARNSIAASISHAAR
jgi:methylenetetrahydrofolate reductase (NADPH)